MSPLGHPTHPVCAHTVPGAGVGSPGTRFAITSAFGVARAPTRSSAEPPAGPSRLGGSRRAPSVSGRGEKPHFGGAPHVPAALAGGCTQPPALSGPALGVTSFPRRALRNHSRVSVPASPPLPGREAQAEGGPRRPSGFGACPVPGLPCAPVPARPGPCWYLWVLQLGVPRRPPAKVSPSGGVCQMGAQPRGWEGAKGMLRVPLGVCTGPRGVPGSVQCWSLGFLGGGWVLWGCGSLPRDARRWGSVGRCLDAVGCGGTGTSLAPTHRGCWGAWCNEGGIWGGFGVGSGRVCLCSCSSTDAQAHGGLSPGAPCQPGQRRGGGRAPGRGRLTCG